MRVPEKIWFVDKDCQGKYDQMVRFGTEEAARTKVAIVAIARNAMPFLRNTLVLVDELAGKFREAKMYVFENDSIDDTASVLDEFAMMRQWVTVEHDTLGRQDMRGFEPERTVALAEYRNRCRAWVEHNAADANYVIVLDMDPHHGFSVDGVMNSVGWICEKLAVTQQVREVGGMASHSLFLALGDGDFSIAAYDAYAARLNWWKDLRNEIGQEWFHGLMFPVGSDPVPFNSAFGGLAVYRREAFLAPGVHYAGGDCEHVHLHRTMQQAGYQLYLNPGCRYVAVITTMPKEDE